MAGNIDPGDDGSRYAYGENGGWINFKPASGDGVTVNPAAVAGFAWGENLGWVSFHATSPVPYRVRTAWIPPDVIPPATSAGGVGSGWSKTDVTLTLVASDNACGAGVKELHTTLDSNPEVITPGPTLSTTIRTEGIHAFRYFAVDNAANPEPASILRVPIDKTAPELTVGSPPAGRTTTSTNWYRRASRPPMPSRESRA
ncbi:MAG TPA: hypothetical protein VLT62_08740 [Candidatus Methylomirabilis sp.]|nr:hypothetical protein [Candidatus Methylomirabilis sp.]